MSGPGSGPWPGCVSSVFLPTSHVLSVVQTHLNGWAGLIRVDGTTYRWLGLPLNMNTSTLISTQVTPTRTILTVQAGPMELTVTFLTPIEVRRIPRAILCDLCFLSQRTGSANLCPSPTCLSKRLPRTATPIAYRSTRTSVQVRYSLGLGPAYPGSRFDHIT